MTSATVRPAARTSHLTLGLAAAVAAAMVINAVIATVVAVLDGSAAPVGLDAPAYLSASLVGVLAAAAGWALVRRSVARPAAVLRALVPAVLVLTWVPDVLVLVAGASVLNVAGLMLMHAVVAASAVVALRRVLPI